jgi:alkylation response protein AidB-like acyl-CoA dehydrogenase
MLSFSNYTSSLKYRFIMAAYLNMDTLRFQLNEVHNMKLLFELDRFSDYDKEAILLFLDSIKDFSDKELYPFFREMDEKPAYYKENGIVTHPQIGVAMKKAAELGMIGATFSYNDGGLQMPELVSQAAHFIMSAANNNITGYPALTAGAADLIITFGSDELKEKYVPNMLSGEWGGTMCLTEPQAGSSLSDITTSATPTEEGHYTIKGQKIFISGGDHPYCENFVHLVLARIDGAPAGTKGISLFVVPKKRLLDNGELASNDVITAGDFQKLGQRGYCTTHLVFGEKENCQGWLVGEAHQGLKYMFQMMNGARISVGRDGVSIASAAYHASLQYANERPQGRRLSNDGTKNPHAEPVLIKEHPDVRRMLLLQKAIYEGSLSLILQTALYHDLSTASEEKEKYHLLLEMLTPITKTYPSEKGREAVDNGLQILGGYGFCTDFVLQQYYRDIRIMAIYEGTTGIQSLDLLGRKVMMAKGKGLELLVAEIKDSITAAMNYDELKPYAMQLGAKLKEAKEVLDFLVPFAMKGQYERFLSDATLFMEYMGTLIIAWQWLKMGTAAKHALVIGDTTYENAFYESELHTMKFFYKYELSKISGLVPALTSPEVLTLLEGKDVIV